MARSYPRPRQKPVADRYPRPRQKPVDPRQAHIQQLNDELAEDIIAASDSPLVRLGIETIGIEQMTTLFNRHLTGAIFSPEGFTKSRLKELGHDPASPVDTSKPTVVVAAKNMDWRGLAGSRSDIGHEFIHAGIAALAESNPAKPFSPYQPHNIRSGVEESIARHHDMVTGNPEEQEDARELFKEKEWSHELAKDYYDELNKQAAKKLNDQFNKQVADRLRRRQQRIEAKTFELPDDGGFLRNTRVF